MARNVLRTYAILLSAALIVLASTAINAGQETRGLLDDPRLISIIIFERTDSLVVHRFDKNDPRLVADVDQNIPNLQYDFKGTPLEYYDVFVSDRDGILNLHGDYLTIECYFNKRRHGVANNIDAVKLEFKGGTSQWANRVGSYRLGTGPYPLPDGQVNNALGAVDMKHTLLGYGYTRITLGFSHDSKIYTYRGDFGGAGDAGDANKVQP